MVVDDLAKTVELVLVDFLGEVVVLVADDLLEEVVVLVVLIRLDVVAVVLVVLDDLDDDNVLVETVDVAEEARAAYTPSKNPEFATIWLISHIITPPKLVKVLQYAMTEARPVAFTYPLPAPVLAGTPKKTFTPVFLLALAHVSHVSKLKLA